MPRLRRLLLLCLLGLIALFATFACSGGGDAIRVASKNFAEQEILGEPTPKSSKPTAIASSAS